MAVTNQDALDRTLEVLTSTGKVEDNTDAAIVQALRSMAEQLDRDPSNAALWRQYRETLKELTADGSDGSVAGDIAALLSTVRDQA